MADTSNLIKHQSVSQQQINLLSPKSRSSIFTTAKSQHLPTARELVVNSELAAPEVLSMFRGHKQPLPIERLRQAKIFLADEDYYRNLNFTQKLEDVDAYVSFLERNQFHDEDQIVKEVSEMIDVHKSWIKSATQLPSLSFNFLQSSHKNRLIYLIKDPKKLEEISKVKASALFRDQLPDLAPAIHQCIDEHARKPSPDPFLYTKKAAQIRGKQQFLAAARQQFDISKSSAEPGYISAPVNFNGPYIPIGKNYSGSLGGNISLDHNQKIAMLSIKSIVDAETNSVKEIAERLAPGEILTEAEAAYLLQREVIRENNRNGGTRVPNFSTIWAFAEDVLKPKQFFSLDKWPPNLQTPERREEIERSGPRSRPASMPKQTALKNGKATKAAAPADPREQYVPGETLFPFGETAIQQAIESQSIANALANEPRFAYLYVTNDKGDKVLRRPARRIDPFALPALPELPGETPYSNQGAGEPANGVDWVLSFLRKKREAKSDDTTRSRTRSGIVAGTAWDSKRRRTQYTS